MILNVDFINGYLSGLSALGEGVNHVNCLYCENIEMKENLEESINHHLKKTVLDIKYKYKKHSENPFTIDITLNINSQLLEVALQKYLFDLDYSPILASEYKIPFFKSITDKLGITSSHTSSRASSNGLKREDISKGFLNEIEYHSNGAIFKIHSLKITSDELFYGDIENDDFILDFDTELYYLHFGWNS